jgi:hypothetical protein
VASKLTDIYDALANKSIILDGVPVPCQKLEETTGVIFGTPQRVLSPLSERNEGRGLVPLTFGGAATLQWFITELLLLAGVEDGTGLEFHTPRLVKCQAAYVANVFSDRSLGIAPAPGSSSSVVVNGADIEAGVYEYPLGTGAFYYGIKVAWTIRENLS